MNGEENTQGFKKMNNQPGLRKKEVKPSMNRRADFHDYRLPGIYMFTVFKHPAVPALAGVAGDPHRRPGDDNSPGVLLSGVGRIFDEELMKTAQMRERQLSILSYVIMPDHAHILVCVKEKLKRPITNIISMIESATTRRSREAGLIADSASVFRGEGINDRIVFDQEQLDILIRYIADNPRRLLIKRLYPDLFRRNLSVNINGDVVDCVGNMFLLRKPLMAVHVRRKWSAGEVEAYKARCIEAALNGVVLISPFIHPDENEIRKEVLEAGGSVIQIVDHGFAERFKPAGKSMDTCAEGRLLLVSEAGAAVRAEDMSYAKASRLNRLAERIASLGSGLALSLRKASGEAGRE